MLTVYQPTYFCGSLDSAHLTFFVKFDLSKKQLLYKFNNNIFMLTYKFSLRKLHVVKL